MTGETEHLGVLSVNVWSHHRPLLVWILSLVLHDPSLHVTHFASIDLKEKTEQLMAKFPLQGTATRYRIIWLDISNPSGQRLPFSAVADYVLQHHYEPLMAGQPVEEHAALPPPAALFCDMLVHSFVDRAKERGFGGETLLWLPSEATAMASAYSSVKHSIDGGAFDAVIDAPGLVPRYIYEYSVTTTPMSSPVGQISDMMKFMFKSSSSGQHSTVNGFSRLLVPGADQKLSHMLKGAGVMDTGPLYEPSFWEPPPAYPADDALFQWLGKQEKNSVLFISWGSNFWPVSNPWQVELLVDLLIESNTPFVLLTGTMMTKFLPDGFLDTLREKVTKSGNMAPGWIDQALALSHPAIAWALHQGGPGGTIESLRFGLPFISWPFMADQAPLADLTDTELDVSWALWQTRDRLAGRKIASKPGFIVEGTPNAIRAELESVLAAARGEEGKRKRANAQRASKVLLEEHAQQGQVMNKFLSWAFPGQAGRSS